jgi:hypothetical protein
VLFITKPSKQCKTFCLAGRLRNRVAAGKPPVGRLSLAKSNVL